MTAKQVRALQALCRSPTLEAAAEEAGVATSTLRRWRKEDPAFLAAYRDLQSEMLQDATQQARAAIEPALSALTGIVKDDNADSNSRIAAARALLSNALKMIEVTDISERISAMEEQLEGGK